MTDNTLIHLAKGNAVCQLAPASGGSIKALECGGVPVLRRKDGDHTLDMACFPMLPFANRIAHGRISLNGQDRAIGVDPLSAPHAIHGHGWQRVWSVEEAGPDHATLRLDEATDEANAWPWPYTAWQTFTLERDCLWVDMTIENRHESEAMPAGFGIHPYFARSPQSTVTASAEVMWFNDPTGLAVHPQESGLFSGAPVGIEALEGLDNFFVAPDPCIVVGGPEWTVTLSGPGAGFHVYCPGDEDCFCIEPVSHAPNSFGRGEWGPQDLVPAGERRSLRYRIAFQC